VSYDNLEEPVKIDRYRKTDNAPSYLHVESYKSLAEAENSMVVARGGAVCMWELGVGKILVKS
jgi:hypothetical protein